MVIGDNNMKTILEKLQIKMLDFLVDRLVGWLHQILNKSRSEVIRNVICSNISMIETLMRAIHRVESGQSKSDYNILKSYAKVDYTILTSARHRDIFHKLSTTTYTIEEFDYIIGFMNSLKDTHIRTKQNYELIDRIRRL